MQPVDCIVALDVGGSSVKSALVPAPDPAAIAVTTTPVDSRGDKNAILGTFKQVIQQHLQEVKRERCLGVGIGFPGPFDYPNGTALVRGVEKYEALYGVNLRAALRTDFGGRPLPLEFANDAACAILAETRYGTARHYTRVLGVALGTGMGSAFVVDGGLVTAGPGIPGNGYLYAQPFAGVAADDVFSTRGLVARLRRVGVAPNIPFAAERARAGDSVCKAIFEGFGHDLGMFLVPFAAAFGADALVVVGGIAHSSDLFGVALRKRLTIPVYTPSLGDKAGVIGASLLL